MHRRGKQWVSATVMGLAALLGLLTQTAGAATHDSGRVKRILVLGDSLSEGFLLKPSEAWPMVMVDKLRAAGITHYEWTEPDNDLGFTAAATASIDGAQREALKNYRLWKDVRCPAVSDGTPPSKGGSVGANPTGTASSLPEGGRQLLPAGGE